MINKWRSFPIVERTCHVGGRCQLNTRPTTVINITISNGRHAEAKF